MKILFEETEFLNLEKFVVILTRFPLKSFFPRVRTWIMWMYMQEERKSRSFGLLLHFHQAESAERLYESLFFYTNSSRLKSASGCDSIM